MAGAAWAAVGPRRRPANVPGFQVSGCPSRISVSHAGPPGLISTCDATDLVAATTEGAVHDVLAAAGHQPRPRRDQLGTGGFGVFVFDHAAAAT